MSATLPLPDTTQPKAPSAWARLGSLMTRRYRESWLDGLTPPLPVRVLLAEALYRAKALRHPARPAAADAADAAISLRAG